MVVVIGIVAVARMLASIGKVGPVGMLAATGKVAATRRATAAGAHPAAGLSRVVRGIASFTGTSPGGRTPCVGRRCRRGAGLAGALLAWPRNERE